MTQAPAPTEERSDQAERRPRPSGVDPTGAIDCDVHPGFVDGFWDLKPYIDDYWLARIGMRDEKGSGTGMSQGFKTPKAPWLRLPAYPGRPALRQDCAPPGGGPPGSDPEFMVQDLLDRYELGAAVLIGGDIRDIGGLPDQDLAGALARAHNDWIADVWMETDPRFKGSITIAPQDPAQAVAEIERWGDHPSMLQVHINNSDRLLGKRHFWPIYEAAEAYQLPIALHPGGEGAGVNSSMSAGEPPSYFMEFHSALSQHYQANLTSLVAEGTFERFPGLRVVLVEGGFAWLPHIMWRLNKNWRALRDEVPWLKRLPSEYIVEHVRVTSQPLYEPEDTRHLEAVLEMIDAERTLMFSTDYPHWDGDDPVTALRTVPASVRERMLELTPKELYTKLS